MDKEEAMKALADQLDKNAREVVNTAKEYYSSERIVPINPKPTLKERLKVFIYKILHPRRSKEIRNLRRKAHDVTMIVLTDHWEDEKNDPS